MNKASNEQQDQHDVEKVRNELGLSRRIGQVEEFDDEKVGQDLLKCGICLDTLYIPVSLSCGHSFCRLCLANVVVMTRNEFFGRFRCPYCKSIACNKCMSRFAINHSLWAVIQQVFPDALKTRNKQQAKKTRKPTRHPGTQNFCTQVSHHTREKQVQPPSSNAILGAYPMLFS